MSDIKANLIELSGPLGLNLASEDTRIKHSKTGELNISSNGTINIEPTVKLGVTTNEIDIISDTINITAKKFTIVTKDLTAADAEDDNDFYLNIMGGKGYESTKGVGIKIMGGAGDGPDGSGGDVSLVAGGNSDGSGGDIIIGAGDSKRTTGSFVGGSINLETGYGKGSYGNMNITLGDPYHYGEFYPLGTYGPSGKVKVNFGALQLAVFDDIPATLDRGPIDAITNRDTRIPDPEKGDMCMVNDLIYYYNGTEWKALQPMD